MTMTASSEHLLFLDKTILEVSANVRNKSAEKACKKINYSALL